MAALTFAASLCGGSAAFGGAASVPVNPSGGAFANGGGLFSTPRLSGTSQTSFDVPGVVFGSPMRGAPAPFGFETEGPLGYLHVAGYTEQTTAPRLLSGGLVARDGSSYTVRDLEIMDQVGAGVALDLGYNLDLDRQFFSDSTIQPGGGLFVSSGALPAVFSALTDRADYFGVDFALADGLDVRLGQSILQPFSPEFGISALDTLARAGFDGREAETSMAGVDWNFAPWGTLGLDASQSASRGGVWDSANPAGLALAKAANSAEIGASARLALGGGWVTTFSYNQGVTQLDLRPTANLATSQDTLHGGGYGLAIAKRGLFGDDTFGLALTRPLQIYSGGFDFGGAANADPLAGLLLGSGRLPLAGQAHETDLDFGYVTTFMDGALALQANAGYQMNLAGQGGTNGVSVLSRAKINF